MEVVGAIATQEAAIEHLPTSAPDLILMRFELAQLDARGMLPENLTRDLRTLLLLDDVHPEKLAQAMRCGAHGALTRKSNAEEIIRAIEKTCAGELWFGREITNLVLTELRAPNKQAVPRADANLDRLTPRERKVLDMVIISRSEPYKSLAKRLFISESTLRNHLSSIYQKLGVGNRLALYMYAQNSGYTPLADKRVA